MPARKKFEKKDPQARRRPKSSNLNNAVSRCAAIRIDQNLTQTELSVHAGVNIQAIIKIEKGDIQKMQLETIIRVAMALNVPPADLIPALAYKPRRVLRVPSRKKRSHVITEERPEFE